VEPSEVSITFLYVCPASASASALDLDLGLDLDLELIMFYYINSLFKFSKLIKRTFKNKPPKAYNAI
jgi:hypothetical protein